MRKIKVTPENIDEVIEKVKENPDDYKVSISLTPLGKALADAINRLGLVEGAKSEGWKIND